MTNTNITKTNQNPLPRFKRPIFLRLVLILSAVGSLAYLLAHLWMLFFFDRIQDMLVVGEFSGILRHCQIYLEIWMAQGRLFLLLMSGCYLASLFGVFVMWQRKRRGLVVYAFAQSASLLIPVLFIGRGGLALGDTMLVLLFVVYYFSQRNLLKGRKPKRELETSDGKH